MRTHNDYDGIVANGTSLMGYVDASYGKLRSVFGPPLSGSSGDGKVQCEWLIEFDDGTVGTIYDYKSSVAPEHNRDWHVGGRVHRVVAMIQSELNR